MNDYQKQLFPYAYNILGSAEDAKDVIQDVMSAYWSGGRTDIEDTRNYLIKSVINRSITFKEKRQKQQGQAPVWLPEPVATEDAADRNTYLNEILSYSLMILLERLTPTERAVFILKESLDYTHKEIADVLGITEEHSRKLLSRAKEKLFKPGTPSLGGRPTAAGVTPAGEVGAGRQGQLLRNRLRLWMPRLRIFSTVIWKLYAKGIHTGWRACSMRKCPSMPMGEAKCLWRLRAALAPRRWLICSSMYTIVSRLRM